MHESESESEAAQLCPTLLDPKDCSPPGSSVHGMFQAGGLERAATAFSAINMQCLSNTIAITITTRGFPGGAVVKNPPANAGDGGPISGWGDPLEEGTAAAPLFLPGEFHEWRNLAGYHPWGNKESDTTEHAHTHTHPLPPWIHLLLCFPMTCCALFNFILERQHPTLCLGSGSGGGSW